MLLAEAAARLGGERDAELRAPAGSDSPTGTAATQLAPGAARAVGSGNWVGQLPSPLHGEKTGADGQGGSGVGWGEADWDRGSWEAPDGGEDERVQQDVPPPDQEVAEEAAPPREQHWRGAGHSSCTGAERQRQQQQRLCEQAAAAVATPARPPLQTFNGMFVARRHREGTGLITAFFKAPGGALADEAARPPELRAPAAVAAAAAPQLEPQQPWQRWRARPLGAGAAAPQRPVAGHAAPGEPLPHWIAPWQRLPGTNIIVDCFTSQTRGLATKSWILSHFHADHYGVCGLGARVDEV